MKPPRLITGVDRMLAWSDRADRALGEPAKSRRRTHLRFGKLDLIVVEVTGEPTVVYLTNGSDATIVEASAGELAEAADAVRTLMANPPPLKRRTR